MRLLSHRGLDDRRPRVLITLAADVSLLLILLTLEAGLAAPASAEPQPFLKIADELVPVPSGFTSASWDCRCDEPVTLIRDDRTTGVQTVVYSNAPGVANRAAMSGFEVGHVYRFRLVSQDGPYAYADAGPIRGVEGAREALIDGGLLATPVVSPNGISALFRLGTSRPAVIHVTVGTQPPYSTPGGLVLPAAGVVASDYSRGAVQDLSTTLWGLKAAQQYYFVVRAVDTSLRVQTVTGSFTTKKRTVDVTFGRIRIVDDSDDLSDGEISFTFRAHDSASVQQPHYNLGTGDFLNIPLTIRWTDTRPGSNDPMILTVYGHEDDWVFGGIECVVWGLGWWAPGYPTSASVGQSTRSTECSDVAEVNAAVPVVPAYQTGRELFTSDPIILHADQGALKFDAEVVYTVSYR